MKDEKKISRPLLHEGRLRLLSLWEMLRVAADSFVNSLMSLKMLAAHMMDPDSNTYPLDLVPVLTELTERLKTHFGVLGARTALIMAERISHEIQARPGQGSRLLRSYIEDMTERLEDELTSVLFFFVPFEKAQFYEPKQPLFGEQVRDHFPSATYDIDEAGKCFALSRYTACVVHLMRALEVCLKLLAQELSVSYDGGGNWNKVLNEFDKVLQEKLRENTKTKLLGWKEQEEFYSEASALLRNVKNAWRNSVMHAKHIYDEDRARTVFDAVGGIMRYLATRLKEDQPPLGDDSSSNS